VRAIVLLVVAAVVAAAGLRADAAAVAAPAATGPAAMAQAPTARVAAAPTRRTTLGRSVQGRRLVVTRVGAPGARVRVLVVGSVHGDEPAGEAVIARLRRGTPPAGVQLLLVRTANPDGRARGTRTNARGVDLNRNFPTRWRRGGDALHWSGPRPLSEPESSAMARLARAERPVLSVWYHQALALVNRSPGADPRIVRAYARRARLPVRTLPRYRGTAVEWQNALVPRGSAFVVELPGGRLPAASAGRHAAAVLALAGRYARAR
jgi:protein MpaA